MKAKKLREQSNEELAQLSVETRRGICEIKAKKGTKDQSDQPLRIRMLRRDQARIQTVLRERGGEGHA